MHEDLARLDNQQHMLDVHPAHTSLGRLLREKLDEVHKETPPRKPDVHSHKFVVEFDCGHYTVDHTWVEQMKDRFVLHREDILALKTFNAREWNVTASEEYLALCFNLGAKEAEMLFEALIPVLGLGPLG